MNAMRREHCELAEDHEFREIYTTSIDYFVFGFWVGSAAGQTPRKQVSVEPARKKSVPQVVAARPPAPAKIGF